MRHAKTILAISLLSLAVIGCGVDDSTETFSVGDLAGSYQVGPECTVEANGGTATTEGCTLRALGRPTEVDGQATLGEDRVTFSGSGTRLREGCDGEVLVCEFTAEGSADKQEGAQADGDFSAFAGRWTGSYRTVQRCPGNPHTCESTPVEWTSEVTFDAVVDGDSMVLTTNDNDYIEVFSTPEGLRVDGDLVPRQ